MLSAPLTYSCCEYLRNSNTLRTTRRHRIILHSCMCIVHPGCVHGGMGTTCWHKFNCWTCANTTLWRVELVTWCQILTYDTTIAIMILAMCAQVQLDLLSVVQLILTSWHKFNLTSCHNFNWILELIMNNRLCWHKFNWWFCKLSHVGTSSTLINVLMSLIQLIPIR